MPSKSAQKKKSPLRRLAGGGGENDNLGVKLLTLLFIIVLLTFSYFALSQKKDAPKKAPRLRAEILGEESRGPIEDLANLGRQAETAVVDTARDVQNASGQVLGMVTSSAASFVVENAGESVFKQIEKLPPQQQEELKKQICK